MHEPVSDQPGRGAEVRVGGWRPGTGGNERSDIVLIPIPFTDLSSQKPLIVKTLGRVNDRTLDRIRAALTELTKSNP